jgi:hypothetical protein
MHFYRGLGGIALLVLAVGGLQADTKILWRFDEGEKFWMESIISTRDVLKDKVGAQAKQDAERTTLTSFTVRRKNADGSVVLDQKLESMKVTIQGNLPKPDAELYKLMEGATFRLTLSPKMELKGFEGYEQLAQRITAANPEVGKLFRQNLPEEMMRRSVEEAFGFLPDKELKPGTKWDRKLVLALGPLGSLSGLNHYTYRGYINGKEHIDVEGNLSYVPPSNATDFVFQVTKGNLAVENVRGTMLFDSKLGKLVQSEIRLRVKGSLVVQVQREVQAIDVDQEQTVRTRFMDKPPGKQ